MQARVQFDQIKSYVYRVTVCGSIEMSASYTSNEGITVLTAVSVVPVKVRGGDEYALEVRENTTDVCVCVFLAAAS